MASNYNNKRQQEPVEPVDSESEEETEDSRTCNDGTLLVSDRPHPLPTEAPSTQTPDLPLPPPPVESQTLVLKRVKSLPPMTPFSSDILLQNEKKNERSSQILELLTQHATHDKGDHVPNPFMQYRQSVTILPDKSINILLLGETGVGKSTFINSFANYICYDSLKEAKDGEIISLIPSSFTVTDINYEEKEVSLGKDKNESTKDGQSSTQQCRSYLFPFGDNKVQITLIDTPGVGDTRGLDQDRLNFDNILQYISQFKEIHCICILLKPNNARITVLFEFYIKQLLFHLHKSASNNIVFLFTNARSTFYRPGDTAKPLKKILSDIKSSPPFVDIKYCKETIYCFDNEAFRFLVALKNGIQFDQDEVENFPKSWSSSAKECVRLIKCIIGEENRPGLIPHKVQDTISINEARRQIVSLSQPLTDIAQNIEDNLKLMNRQKEEIAANASNIEELKKKLFIPYIDVQLIEIPHPKTVCAADSCCETYNVLGLTKRKYTQVCHDPCSCCVPRKIMGDPELMNCIAMDGNGNCTECRPKCNYLHHLHVYYETKSVEKKRENITVKGMIENKESAKKLAENKIKEIKDLCDQNKKEADIITKTTAKFAHFLKNNAITPYNDSFESYLRHLIENEKSMSRKGDNNHQIIKGLEDTHRRYKEEKDILDKAMACKETDCSVTADEVFTSIKKLYSLKINGKKIKESQEKQSGARKFNISSLNN